MIQFSVVYNYKKRLKKNGTAPVHIRAYQDGKCKLFATGVFLTPYQWSKKWSKVIDHPNTLQYNAEFRRQLDEIEAFTLEWIKVHGSITLNQLEYYFKYEDVKSFTAFWKAEMEEEERLHKRTIRNHRYAYNLWIVFKKDVQFSELNYNLINDFDNFLYKKKLHVNTIYSHHKQVKRYINLAIKKGVLKSDKNPYVHFTAKSKPSERTVLTELEVQRIEELSFEEDLFYMELIRDMFLFACYTGLRYSDLRALSFENVERDAEGFVLKIIAQKTDKKLTLPLYKLHNKKPEQIIEKYLVKGHKHSDLIFHKYCNQYYNRALKKIAKMAGIHKSVTSHVARHTFATHLASKIPIHILKSMLQHSKIETTMVYLHLSNKMVSDALDGVSW